MPNAAAKWYNVPMNIPSDSFILLSYVNTQLRDNYGSLDELCGALDVGREELEERLGGIGYRYSEEQNAFIRV